MVKKLIASTAGALFLVGQSVAVMAAPALPTSAQRVSSSTAQAQKQGFGSNFLWILIFLLITAAVIAATQNASNNPSNAPASP